MTVGQVKRKIQIKIRDKMFSLWQATVHEEIMQKVQKGTIERKSVGISFEN